LRQGRAEAALRERDRYKCRTVAKVTLLAADEASGRERPLLVLGMPVPKSVHPRTLLSGGHRPPGIDTFIKKFDVG
jgi:hypothetical protein